MKAEGSTVVSMVESGGKTVEDHAPSRSRFGGLARRALPLLAACLALALAACAPLPQAPEQKPADAASLVFPPPPDEPRFVYERSLYGSADVVPEDENSKLRQLLTGEGAKSGEGLAKPYAVAVFQGRGFVSDFVNDHHDALC